MKTLRVSSREASLLNLSRFPNAGPNPDVIGMKMKWGGRYSWRDVPCITDGTYLYKVDYDTYMKVKEASQ